MSLPDLLASVLQRRDPDLGVVLDRLRRFDAARARWDLLQNSRGVLRD